PQVALIAACVVALGAEVGFWYAWIATIVSGVATYFTGRLTSAQTQKRFGGATGGRFTRFMGKNGFLASLIVRFVPSIQKVRMCTSGTEATMSAIRLARAYQVAKGRESRWKVIGRHPSYHGMTIGTMAVASHSGRQKGYEPLLLPFPKVPWDDPEQVLKVIEQEDPATIAGFIAEPITGAAGACLTASDEYWQVVSDACREHDILLIADEVMTGYGRTGLKFGHQHFPFHPDVIVGGKGLGGGYVPMGAVTARDEVAEALRGSGFMYFTFTGNDAACAASAKVLEIMRREQLVERSATVGAHLGTRMRAEFSDHPAVVDIRGRGMFYGLELRCNRDEVVMAAMDRDLWVYPAGSGPVADAVMVAPPYVITEAEIEQLLATLRAALDAVHPG
ncbi:MAG: aminotransferase class III-fold pyridoxal phosphate-dependent enzyme, partial [Ilumatobacteraceae bacterium]